jgi:hypothetical protein
MEMGKETIKIEGLKLLPNVIIIIIIIIKVVKDETRCGGGSVQYFSRILCKKNHDCNFKIIAINC